MDDIARLGLIIETGQVRGAISELNSLQNQARNVESQTGRMSNSFSKLNQVLAGISAGAVAKSLSGLADSATSVENALRQVTTGNEELAQSSAALLTIANDTRSSYESTVELYSKLARSTQELGISQDKLYRVTEVINKSFAASGATAIEAGNAIRQLAQGLSAGALRGDEFNAVAEQAPDILRAVAAELRVNFGEVRKLAGEGKLTSEVLIRSIDNYGATVDRNFAKASATMGQFFEVAKNNAIREVQQSKTIRDANQAVGEALVAVSNNIGNLAEAGKAAGTVLAAYLVVNLTKTATATVQTTVASIAATAERRRAIAATIAAAEVEVGYLRTVQLSLAAQLGSAQTEAIRAGIRTQLAANTAALTTATAGLATAQGAAAATATALGTATSFLLGPWGLLLTTVGAAAAVFYATKEASAETSAQFDKDAAIIQKLAEKYDRMSEGARGAAAKNVHLELIKNSEALAQAENELKLATLGNIGGNQGMLGILEEKKNKVAALKDKEKELNLQLTAVNQVIADTLPNATNMTNALATTTSTVAAAESEFDKLKQSLINQIIELQTGEEAFQRYEAQMRLGAKATAEEKQEIDALVLAFQKLNAEKKKKDEADRTTTKFKEALKDTGSQNNPAQQAKDEYDARIKLAEEYAAIDQKNYEESLKLKKEAYDRFSEEIAEIERKQKGEGLLDRVTTSLASFKDQVSGTMASVALGFQDGDEAAKQLAQTILTQLVGAVINYGIEQAIAYATGATAATAAEATKTAAVVASVGAQTTAAVAATGTVTGTAVASGASIATAMAPAAAASSIASFGAAPAAATPIALGSIAAIIAAIVGGMALFGRAQGGSVGAGQTYKFAENGPELFTPRTAGKVTPFHQLLNEARGGGGGNVKQANITFDIKANDATGFEEMLNNQRDTIYNIVQRALNDRGRDL